MYLTLYREREEVMGQLVHGEATVEDLACVVDEHR